VLTAEAKLIDNVREFTLRYKAKPPRSTKLGWDLYLALKRPVGSPGQSTLRKLVSQLGSVHASSITHINCLDMLSKKGRPLPNHLNKFATNQRRKGSLCASSAAVARPSGNSARGLVKLDPVDVMNHKDGFQQTPQVVVDLLYLMLANWISVSRRLSLQWCVTWGTLLGCIRGKAMLGHDYDVDVTLFVDSADVFWQDTFPLLVVFFESRGFRLVRANLRYAKVLAGDCGKSSDWFELKAASARTCSNRSTIIRDASAMQHAGIKVEAQTPHVLDILVAATPNFKEGPHSMSKHALAPFTMKPFASLTVPTPANAESVLALWFGPCWQTNMYFKDPVTYKMCPVPPGARKTSKPSPRMAKRLKAIAE